MKIHPLQELYVQNGFFWNESLAELCSEFGGKEFTYRHPKSGMEETARFEPSNFVRVGRQYGMYNVVINFLGEEVAPVGECNRGHIRLLLTESAKLIGFADYLLLRWGNPELDWRSSLALLLQGEGPAEIGVIEN